MAPLGRVFAVLFLQWYAFAIVGTELFATKLGQASGPNHQPGCDPDWLSEMMDMAQPWTHPKYDYCRLSLSSFGKLGYWHNNFDSMANAMVTLFEQMVVNNW